MTVSTLSDPLHQLADAPVDPHRGKAYRVKAHGWGQHQVTYAAVLRLQVQASRGWCMARIGVVQSL